MNIIYRAEAVTAGTPQERAVRTLDGQLDLALVAPQEMGGTGEGANPEQLFAAGYASCFHSALNLTARTAGQELGETSVGVRVGIGPNGRGGFGFEVDMEVTIPGLPQDQAQALAEAAHQVCPYSNATRGNMPVTMTVVAA